MSKKREQIIDTAVSLFARDGFHATGVDSIVAKAGTTKRTLYKHFMSKDKLVVAALQKHHLQFVENFSNGVMNSSAEAKERLLAIFDVAHDWFSDDKFYGCMFINAISEYAETNKEVRKVAQGFKQEVRGFIEGIALQAQMKNAADLANKLALLLEGSIVTAQVSHNPNAADQAKKIAKVLIDGHQ